MNRIEGGERERERERESVWVSEWKRVGLTGERKLRGDGGEGCQAGAGSREECWGVRVSCGGDEWCVGVRVTGAGNVWID